MKEKKCSKCGASKPPSEFHKNMDRLRSWCKPCQAIADRAKHYRRTFGITIEELEQIFESQNEKCAICQRDMVLRWKNYQLDHDHETGKIRGILCVNCNTALGTFGDNLAGIMKVVEYLKTRG